LRRVAVVLSGGFCYLRAKRENLQRKKCGAVKKVAKPDLPARFSLPGVVAGLVCVFMRPAGFSGPAGFFASWRKKPLTFGADAAESGK
jgi:hypothetical protein